MTVPDVHLIGQEQIASYESLDSALRAVSHLVELEYPPEAVAISPKRFRTVDGDHLRGRLRRGLTTGAMVGAILVGVVSVVAALGLDTLIGSVLLPAAIAAGVGAIAGVALVLASQVRERARRWGEPPAELVPTAFDVVVSRDPADARHDLAQWWDPRAAPSSPGAAG